LFCAPFDASFASAFVAAIITNDFSAYATRAFSNPGAERHGASAASASQKGMFCFLIRAA
jgi:hypothetical protein